MSRVIIAGAGGFVGSALTRKFIENGIKVLAISQVYNSSFPNSPLIDRIEADIVDHDTLVQQIPEDEYDAFYNLAWRGVNGKEKADPLIQVDNIKMALICANAASTLHCKKYLCAGTIAERSVESLKKLSKTSGGMAYGTAKYCAYLMLETYCKNIGLDFVWMQFSNIYGPHNKTGNLISYALGELTQGKVASFGPANQPYDFIYVDDLIEAVFRLGNCRTSSNIYFIGSGEPRVLKDYLLEIGELAGTPELVEIGKRPDDGIVYSFDMFDTNLLKQEIGNYVSKNFTDGIKDTLEAYKKN